MSCKEWSGLGVCHGVECVNLLAQAPVIPSAVAFAEQDGHAFRHIDPEETIPEADYSGKSCQCDRLNDGIVHKVLSAECSVLHVELHHESTVKALRDSTSVRVT